MDDKIIVTNKSALVVKYGASGYARIHAALAQLIAADRARGIKTRLICLDHAATMQRLRAPAVTNAADPRQNKRAIDAVFQATRPDYLLLLGAVDVIPHQDIRNPAFSAGDDDDALASGDLPYACEAGYSRDVAKFKAPSRVVGRLPDLTGAKTPAHLLSLLSAAAAFRSRPAADYGAYFGLSTASWAKSTGLSLENIFGDARAMRTSPRSGPGFSKTQLAPLSHFINCHGGLSDPRFYGEEDKENDPEQPVAMTSLRLRRKIKRGTVVAAECCYGAELYDSVTLGLPLPISQQYLLQGACGFFGSSTIAYGPAEGNGSADLITQYFLLQVLQGASLGRAALVARQQFAQQAGELDPMDLKTLAQFNLLGDPSLHPAIVPSATGIPKGTDAEGARRSMRKLRRAKLQDTALFLEVTKPTATRLSRTARRSATVKRALSNIARSVGRRDGRGFTAFDVQVPPGTGTRAAKAAGVATRYYVDVFRRKGCSRDQLGTRVAAVAREVSGRIVGYRIYREK
ncbi:MAG TPA: hypothetical protein VF277_01885 [Steroidobacteraceae bacterium]